MAETFRSAFTKDNLMSAATYSVVAGQSVNIGSYQVQAGEQVMLGWGQSDSQEGASGRIYMELKDNAGTPALLQGKVRFTVLSPQKRPLRILGEFRTETLRTDAVNRTLQVPFPQNNVFISEDKYLVIEFISDTTATLSKANSTVLMDITQAVV